MPIASTYISDTVSKAKSAVAELSYQAAIVDYQGDITDEYHRKISILSDGIRTFENQIGLANSGSYSITTDDELKILHMMIYEGNLNKYYVHSFEREAVVLNDGNTFLKLLDTPKSYNEEALIPVVNSGKTGLVFKSIVEILPPSFGSTLNKLVYGCSYTFDAVNKLKLNITAGEYVINGIDYIISASSVIIAAGDATYSRFDALVLTTAGTATIGGSASATPTTPTIPSDNILLGYINVPAGATSSGGSSTIGTFVYLSQNGNDVTAQRGNPEKKFLTYDVALAACLIGDVLYIEPGIFASTATRVIKTGVNIFAPAMVTVINTAQSPLGDGGSTVVCDIDGQITFYFTHTSGSKMLLTGAATTINVTGKVVINDSNTSSNFGAAATLFITGSAAVVNLTNTVINTTARPLYLGSSGTKARLTMTDCITSPTGNSTYNFINNVYFRARRCIFNMTSNSGGTGSFAITRNATTAAGDFIFEDCRFYDPGDWYTIFIGLAYTGNGLTFIGTNIIYNSATAISISCGVTTPAIRIMGTLYTNTAPDGAYTVIGGGSVITDTNVLYAP